MPTGPNTTRFLTGTKLFSCFLAVSLTATSSSYILPYPSFMPGHKFYRIEEVFDQLYGWWSFGSLAQFKYRLKMADKKLVEAKILFEYGQLSLGMTTLQKHRLYLNQAFIALEKAKKEEKDISQKRKVFLEALKKHKEVLNELLSQVPEAVYWEEEKREGGFLEIREEINSSQKEIETLSQKLVAR